MNRSFLLFRLAKFGWIVLFCAATFDGSVAFGQDAPDVLEPLVQRDRSLSSELDALIKLGDDKPRQEELAEEIVDLRLEIEVLEMKQAIKQKLAAQKQRRSAMIQSLLSDDTTVPSANDSDSKKSKASVPLRLKAGDTVAIYLDGVLPFRAPDEAPGPGYHLPVLVYPSGQAATGYPHRIVHDGTIQLPWVDPIKVGGMTIREAERAISAAYVESQILRKQMSQSTLTLVSR